MSLPPFHFAFPVDDLAAARRFYGELLGCPEGRSADHWVDFDLHGHQIVAHLAPEAARAGATNPVDGEDVPVPHFGLVLQMDRWKELAGRLVAPVFQESFGARAGFPQDHRLFAGFLPADRLRLREMLAPYDGILVVGAPVFRQSPYAAGRFTDEETRIFVLGESAAQGIPDPSSSFARIAEVMLRDWYPDRRFEVINTAMTATPTKAPVAAMPMASRRRRARSAMAHSDTQTKYRNARKRGIPPAHSSHVYPLSIHTYPCRSESRRRAAGRTPSTKWRREKRSGKK